MIGARIERAKGSAIRTFAVMSAMVATTICGMFKCLERRKNPSPSTKEGMAK